MELTKKQVEGLTGKAIFVEGMKRKDGELFSSYVKLRRGDGPPVLHLLQPLTPLEGAREIYIPNEDRRREKSLEEQKKSCAKDADNLDGLIIHSDQGWQYQHFDTDSVLRISNIIQKVCPEKAIVLTMPWLKTFSE